MAVLNEYHKWWLRFSRRIDDRLVGHTVLQKAKRLFDIHFTVLGLLGVFATPVGEPDCYCYICIRSKTTRYDGLNRKRRVQIAKELVRRAWIGKN